MALFGFFSRKNFFNPSGWLGWDNLKSVNANLWSSVKPLYEKQQPAREETFEEAIVRLGMNDADVLHAAKNYRYYALGFLLLGLASFTYAFYLLFSHGSISGCLLGFATTALFFSQTFKYDFWAFQMRRRKLGASAEEWLNYVMGVNKGGSQ